MTDRTKFAALFLTAFALASAPANAQEGSEAGEKRTRLILGPQLSPSWPGADKFSVGPYVDFSRTRDEEFAFEAHDETFGSPLLHAGKFSFGPSFGFIGKRTAADIGADLPKVGFTIEAGAFAQVSPIPELRVRLEGHKGLSGHKGWGGEVSADYIAREGDDWLFSIGPRVTLGDAKYHRAYFGVTPAAATTSGLPAFDPGGGVQSVGLTAGYLRQISRHWGIAVYGRYDRLVGDAADSPVTRELGSRSQPSAGVALSYTFGGSR
ncbi:MltA-interacting MipA precursor [Sphingopyxis sp. LC81]|uniref:MipA/OmpV family protein n=1 Tax=Sphingopyxis sp. LC81 TaxID=1502850 RepID=UPI00050EE1E2|nr:MipA/OmpV family protein [Sphingopyxis sp. LC81]KGB54594.1 MltA-interacting MipA precursor [Sphingopyxis sp. LC81]